MEIVYATSSTDRDTSATDQKLPQEGVLYFHRVAALDSRRDGPHADCPPTIVGVRQQVNDDPNMGYPTSLSYVRL